jgi:hypothetical protein
MVEGFSSKVRGEHPVLSGSADGELDVARTELVQYLRRKGHLRGFLSRANHLAHGRFDALIVDFLIAPIRSMGFALKSRRTGESGTLAFEAYWVLDGEPIDTVSSAFAATSDGAKLKACLAMLKVGEECSVHRLDAAEDAGAG